MFDSGDSGAYGAERKSSAVWRKRCAAPTPEGRIVNKAQLIDAVAMKLDISRRSAGDTVDAVLTAGVAGAGGSGGEVVVETERTPDRCGRVAREPVGGSDPGVPEVDVRVDHRAATPAWLSRHASYSARLSCVRG